MTLVCKAMWHVVVWLKEKENDHRAYQTSQAAINHVHCKFTLMRLVLDIRYHIALFMVHISKTAHRNICMNVHPTCTWHIQLTAVSFFYSAR